MSTTFCIKITQKPQNVVEAAKYACPPCRGRPGLSIGLLDRYFIGCFNGLQAVFRLSFFGSGKENENEMKTKNLRTQKNCRVSDSFS